MTLSQENLLSKEPNEAEAKADVIKDANSYCPPDTLARVKSYASTYGTCVNRTNKRGLSQVRLVRAPQIEICQESISDADLESKHSLNTTIKEDKDAVLFDASDEDTFTLDSFETLIHIARQQNKSLILARAITVDPTNPNHLYYSFYYGHHLNKVLFRTEPDKGLLHRMRSRNPLNNLEIKGEVHYFAVQPSDVDRALEKFEMEMERNFIMRSIKNGRLSDQNMTMVEPVTEEFKGCGHRKSISDASEYKKSRFISGISIIKYPFSMKTGLPLVDYQSCTSLPLPTIIEGKQMDSIDKASALFIPIVYEATYFASDDDFLMRSDVREFFRANCIREDDHILFPLYRGEERHPPVYFIGPDGEPIRAASGPNAAALLGGEPRRMRNLCGLINCRPGMSLTSTRTGVFPMRSLIYLIVLYGVASFLIINFLIPEAFIYLSVFFSILIFMLLVVFFVEWKPLPINFRRRRQQRQEEQEQQEQPQGTGPNHQPEPHQMTGRGGGAAENV